MEISDKGIDMIKSFESLKLRAYKATPDEKYYTIGYGHCDKNIGKKDWITAEEAEHMLLADIEQYSEKLSKSFPWMKQNQFDAVCSLIYNIGWYNFRYNGIWYTFKDIYVRTTEMDCAHKMILYVRAAGKIMLGLQKRRIIEANHFLGQEHFYFENGAIREH